MNELLNIGLSQYGVKEIPGTKHNPTIVGYSKEIGYGVSLMMKPPGAPSS